jgi:2-polyprenyl-6-methoxyphenol hydroxylase-like FAD-dependent oxidoreductase
MAAYWMARCGIKARIVDKRGHKVYNGHADGLRPRTEEIFDSMGGNLQQRIEAEGYIFESFRTWVCIPTLSQRPPCLSQLTINRNRFRVTMASSPAPQGRT